MLVRIGIPPGPSYGSALRSVGAAGLVSANALRRRDNKSFRHPVAGADFGGLTDISLDSAGFVAMVRYGDYRWTTEEYVRLAGSFPWAWWASMDYCCEPQIAHDKVEVRDRVRRTADGHVLCSNMASDLGVAAPMPVLQGWAVDDYLASVDLLRDPPALVGVGSVCRRDVHGADGLISILSALDKVLPKHVQLHLFGVKGTAIPLLLGHPRIASVDSMAWDAASRRECPSPRPVSKRVAHMVEWYRRQTSHANLFARAY